MSGHQDNGDKQKPLPIEAQLNIECDKAAGLLHKRLTAGNYPQDNPTIPDTGPYLYIKGWHITQHIHDTLHSA